MAGGTLMSLMRTYNVEVFELRSMKSERDRLVVEIQKLDTTIHQKEAEVNKAREALLRHAESLNVKAS